MPTLDADQLGASILDAWRLIATTHFNAVKELSRDDLEFLTTKASDLAEGLAEGLITKEQAELEAADMKEALKGMQDVLAVEGKVLAQDLINKASAILAAAVNSATGVKIL